MRICCCCRVASSTYYRPRMEYSLSSLLPTVRPFQVSRLCKSEKVSLRRVAVPGTAVTKFLPHLLWMLESTDIEVILRNWASKIMIWVLWLTDRPHELVGTIFGNRISLSVCQTTSSNSPWLYYPNHEKFLVAYPALPMSLIEVSQITPRAKYSMISILNANEMRPWLY